MAQPLSARNRRWNIGNPAPPDYLAAAGVDPIVATLLYQRNVLDPAAIPAHLEASYQRGLLNPLEMKDMSEASKRIAHAINEGEPMAVYGDFDTDGVTAVTLLMQAISAMGGIIRPYIPHRLREGYGLNHEAVEQLAAEGVRLLITVDCGISNAAEVARARALGLDVIVTDHHHPPAELPQATAVVNPKQPGCNYPYKQLVGVGIAFKLVQALWKQGVRPGELRARDLLDVVALGTVADMGPLDGENRVLVKAGLGAINSTTRPGLKALIRVAGLTQGKVDSGAIGYMLGPRLNAAGRLDDARRAYELLLAADDTSAAQVAHELNMANQQRRLLTRRVQDDARARAEAEGRHQRRIVVLEGEDYPAGVVGLVAGKLVEEWGRPVLLIERKEGESRGSARSVPGFNMVEALESCRELFVRFGGHSAAAGFTIVTSRIPELEQHLLNLAETLLPDELLVPALTIDAEIGLERVGWELHGTLDQLEPFGQANPTPVFMSRGVHVAGVRPFGDGDHLRLNITQHGGRPIEAVAFRFGRFADALQRFPSIDLAYTLEVNEWNNERNLRLNIKDLRRARP